MPLSDRPSFVIGNASELYVMYRLSGWGVAVAQAGPGLPYDLFCEFGGVVKRVQVKGTAALSAAGLREFTIAKGLKEKKTYKVGDYDILALVSLPQERCVFFTQPCRFKYRLTPDNFTQVRERESWEAAFAHIQE